MIYWIDFFKYQVNLCFVNMYVSKDIIRLFIFMQKCNKSFQDLQINNFIQPCENFISRFQNNHVKVLEYTLRSCISMQFPVQKYFRLMQNIALEFVPIFCLIHKFSDQHFRAFVNVCENAIAVYLVSCWLRYNLDIDINTSFLKYPVKNE